MQIQMLKMLKTFKMLNTLKNQKTMQIFNPIEVILYIYLLLKDFKPCNYNYNYESYFYDSS